MNRYNWTAFVPGFPAESIEHILMVGIDRYRDMLKHTITYNLPLDITTPAPQRGDIVIVTLRPDDAQKFPLGDNEPKELLYAVMSTMFGKAFEIREGSALLALTPLMPPSAVTQSAPAQQEPEVSPENLLKQVPTENTDLEELDEDDGPAALAKAMKVAKTRPN